MSGIKYHLKRVVRESALIIEEYSSLVAKIEDILNSQPLTQISPDLTGISALILGNSLLKQLKLLYRKRITKLFNLPISKDGKNFKQLPNTSGVVGVMIIFTHFKQNETGINKPVFYKQTISFCSKRLSYYYSLVAISSYCKIAPRI